MKDQILNAAYNSFAIESDSITESAKVLDSEQLLKAVEGLTVLRPPCWWIIHTS